MKREGSDFQKFDTVVEKILSVSREELQKREKKYKASRAKKKRAKISPASRAPASS